MTTMHSVTLAINETIQARRARGEKVLHLGFGEAGLPVLPSIQDAFARAAGLNGYGSVVGGARARAEAAGWFTRRGLATDADQVIFAPGSKALLFAALATLPGDLVLPTPSWVSYAAQAALLGKDVIPVPISGPAGGIPEPEQLRARLAEAVKAGKKPGVLILTVPDNPTGTVATAEQLREIAGIVEQYGLAVISDEIYASVVHSGEPAPSIASMLPDRVIVTTGLSKSLALGGWRIGYARTPDTEWGRTLMRELVGVASEVWSSLAAPQQEAAAFVLSDASEVLAHIERSTRLHAAVATAVAEEFTRAGAVTRPPTAGFYLYPDFESQRDGLRARGIETGTDLARVLLDEHGVGVLAGASFGDDDRNLRARVATSLLYGSTAEERWASLESADPTSLPWVQASLSHLRMALASLTDSVSTAVAVGSSSSAR